MYIEHNKIPTIADVDVLVCGGGPAGVGAALCAAREGVSVMIIEMQDCLGGTATAGMMCTGWGAPPLKLCRRFLKTPTKKPAIWDGRKKTARTGTTYITIFKKLCWMK